MTDKPENSPAFPIYAPETNAYLEVRSKGMTLRDYFAGQALIGLLAQSRGTATTSDLSEGAEYAYKMAEAMLAAREGK